MSIKTRSTAKVLVSITVTFLLVFALISTASAQSVGDGSAQVRGFQYQVKPGDTLYFLAKRFGTTVEALQQVNNIWGKWIYPGQVLTIPASPGLTERVQNAGPGGLSYTVKGGDTLYFIAKRFGTTVQEIMRANNYYSTWIYPGQVLLVPTTGSWDLSNGGFEYTVKPGDTLYLLARRFGTTVQEIMRASNYYSTWLWIGQTLRIPVEPNQPLQVPEGNQAGPGSADDGSSAPAPPGPPSSEEGEEGVVPVSGEQVSRPEGEFAVFGYYVEDWEGDVAGYQTLTANSEVIDALVSFQYTVDAMGNLTGKDYSEMMNLARSRGLRVYALVHNLTGGGFNRSIAHSVLTNPTIRQNLVNNILRVLRSGAYAGVNIDIENVPPADRHAYTEFVRELAEKLHPNGLEVTLSIPAKFHDDPNNGWSGGFDYSALGRYADKIMIMTYDEHWATGPPGPIASLGWVDKVASYAATQIPPDKVFLGISAYGYDWNEVTRATKALTYEQAVQGAQARGVRIRWDNTAQEPYYRYQGPDGPHTVYFASKESTALRLEVVKKYGLGGIAIWRLGQEDPGIWPLIAQELK